MTLTSYFASLNVLKLFRNMPGGISQGIIWGIMALGIYITFRLLDVADLTVDGSFTTGGAVTVMLILAGWPAWAALLAAMAAGLLAGLVTGLLHTKLGIPAILAGILTQFSLYSVNLHIMGMAANKAVSVDKYHLLLSSRNIPSAILTGILVALALVSVFYWYFGTEQGSAIRATGNNPAMSRALGINIDNMKVIIGEVLGGAILGRRLNFYGTLSFTVVGGIVYYLVIVIVLWLKLNSNDLKLFTAIVVALFLAVPYLRGQKKSSFSKLKRKGA